MSNITTSVNLFNNNNFEVQFSEWPSLFGIAAKPKNYSFDNYVKSITLPDMNIPYLDSQIGHIKQYHPSPIGARDLNDVTVEFLIDDYMYNYYVCKAWHDGTRVGQDKDNPQLPEHWLRHNKLDHIIVVNFDNSGKVKSKLKFARCFLSNVSSVKLEYGTSNHPSFTCTFKYENCSLHMGVDDNLV